MVGEEIGSVRKMDRGSSPFKSTKWFVGLAHSRELFFENSFSHFKLYVINNTNKVEIGLLGWDT